MSFAQRTKLQNGMTLAESMAVIDALQAKAGINPGKKLDRTKYMTFARTNAKAAKLLKMRVVDVGWGGATE